MNSAGGDHNDIDPGQPIRILREQDWETTSSFMGRVRSRIFRRTAASQLASFSWKVPQIALFEMVGVLGHLFSAFGSGRNRNR